MGRKGCLWFGLFIIAIGVVAGGKTVLVNPGDDIQAAIDGASAGDTVLLNAGVYEIDTTLVVNKALTLAGSGASVRGADVGALSVFEVSASDVTIRDLDITWTHVLEDGYAKPETADSLIRVVGTGLSNVQILNNALHVPDQGGAMSTWGARAITVDSSACSGGITINDNTVYNTRNGIVVRYGNTATITGNTVYNTKGGVMNYTSNQADADNRTVTDNSWGTVHNEWDIVWNSANYDPDYIESVLELSIVNNDAYVVDRRDAAGGHAVGNRSHVFLNPTGSTSVHEAKGNMNDPYATFALGVDAVVEGGDIYVDIGAYQEQVVIGKDLEVLGSGLSTIIESPDTLTEFFMASTKKNYPIIYVHDADDVAIRDLVVDGLGKGNANYRFIGIGFHNAGGVVEDVEIRGIKNTPFSGSQHGVAIYAYNEDGSPRTLQVSDSLIYDFQKNGMALLGEGLVVDVSGNIVVGEGGTGTIAQNGIQVGSGAGGVISGNSVAGIWYTGPYWAASGILIQYTDANVSVLGNDVVDSQVPLYVYDASGALTVSLNNLIGGEYGLILIGTPNAEAHYNSIYGNVYGVWNTDAAYGPQLTDMTLNWWGAADGPWVDLDLDDVPEYEGSGDIIYGETIFSPWLGVDPDGDAGTAGVQLVSPLLFIVDDVGPAPAAGYLNAAIDAANTLLGTDTIEVRHGTYDASEPITDGVNMISEIGSAAHTTLDSAVLINAANVLLGKLRQGFTITGPITVGAGIDASTVHINWNDILGVVTNDGDNTLDATFNFWEEDGPETVGLVAIHPILPQSSDTIIGYMDDHNLAPLDAIGLSHLLLGGMNLLRALNVVEMRDVLAGLTEEELEELFEEYGQVAVQRAASMSGGDYEEFVRLLVGFGEVAGGGGGYLAGGGGGTIGDSGLPAFVASELVPLQLELLDPITGEIVDDAIVTFTICGTAPDGTPTIAAAGMMTFDGDLGAYVYGYDTAGLEPGVYDVYLGTSDGRSRHFQIEVTE